MNSIGERPKLWSSNPAPPEATEKEAFFKDYGSSSMNAISFGFVATAILISMFLIMAIFEHLLRSRPSFSQTQNNGGEGALEAGSQPSRLCSLTKTKTSLSEVVTSQSSDLSVLMPGHHYPTYLAQPAPLPCTREGVYWPPHQHLGDSSRLI